MKFKLNDEVAIAQFISQMKTKIRKGEKNVNLAKEYNVNKSYICNIKNGYSWGWLDYVEVIE